MAHVHPQGAATVEVKCQSCKQPFTARVADRARGWGKFCSKSCKAIKQTQRTGRGTPREHPVGSLRAFGYDEPGYIDVRGDWSGWEDHF